MAEFVVAEAGLLGAEEQCDTAYVFARQLGVDRGGGFRQSVQRMLQGSLAYCSRSHDERAVGDCFGNGGEGLRFGEDGGGIDGGACGLEGDGVVVDHAQMAEAEVVHGPGHRADVAGIAGAHQHDRDAVELLAGDQHCVYFRLRKREAAGVNLRRPLRLLTRSRLDPW